MTCDTQIVEKILWSLSLKDKKVGRRVCKEWNRIILRQLHFQVPAFNDCTRDTLCSFSQDLTSLRVTTFILSTPMLVKLSNGHKIHKLVFEDPEVSEDNMIWLLTKCYSVRELEFVEGTGGKRKLAAFLGSKSVKIINMASRTLKSIRIMGQEGSLEPKDESQFTFDCSILRDCASLQSFVIFRMPFLQLKDIQKLPSALGHLALEVDETGKVRRLVNLGFIDFSCPMTVRSFRFIIRLPRLKRATLAPITGQNILDICQTVRIFNAEWCPETNHYQLKVESRSYSPLPPEPAFCL